MTAIRYVTAGQMKRRTGMGRALGYAFPESDEILIREGLPKEVEREVRAHEAEHIEKGEEGPFLGALIGAGASLLGGVLGSKSASKASKAQERAAQESIAFQRESRDLALEYQRPYREASYSATSALMDLTGLSRGTPSGRVGIPRPVKGSSELERILAGSGGGIYGNGIRAALSARQPAQSSGGSDVPNLADYPKYEFQTDPGYEFRMGEGMKGLERGAAARGGLLSGGFARKALRYAQDYASNEYQNVYNRIASIAGFGQVATNSSVGAILGTGQGVGNALTNAGEARASGYIGQGNAWANAINQIGQIDWGGIFGKSGGTGGIGGMA
jgi:hypothetical protein